MSQSSNKKLIEWARQHQQCLTKIVEASRDNLTAQVLISQVKKELKKLNEALNGQ